MKNIGFLLQLLQCFNIRFVGWALALTQLFVGLKEVNAHAAETKSTDYEPHAQVILEMPEVQGWLNRLEAKEGSEKRRELEKLLPDFLYLSDYAGEAAATRISKAA